MICLNCRAKTRALLGADRILAFAELVGKKNVIAGTDCGLGCRVHSQIAWAKLRAHGGREQEIVELNSKEPLRDERNKKQESLEVKV